VNAVKQMQKLLLFLSLLVFALVGNYFGFQLFFGVNFIFGSIATLVAITRLGLIPGVIIAAIGGSMTLILWGHPYALIILILEAIFVGLLKVRLHDLVRADAVFWLCVGVPLVLLFYASSMGMDVTQTSMIALKQPLNGIFNALIATLIIFAWDTWYRPEKTFSIDNLIQLAIFSAVLIPALILLVEDNRALKTHIETAMLDELKLITSSINKQISNETIEWDILDTSFITEHRHENDSSEQYVNWIIRNEHGIVVQHSTQKKLTEGQTIPMKNDLSLVFSNTNELSAMNRWKEARYRYTQPISKGDRQFSLEIEHDAQTIINDLYTSYVRSMTIVVALIVFAGILAILVGRILSKPIIKLGQATHQMGESIEQGITVLIPHNRFMEVNQLAKEFRLLSCSLNNSIDRLNLLANEDELTGIYNRRQSLKYLHEERKRARRYSSGFSIAFFDIDYFKQINDQFGHAIGDEVLIDLSKLVKTLLRETDSFGRWGGDEFLIIIRHSDLPTTLKVVEKIRQEVEVTKMSSIEKNITISVGVTEFLPEDSIEKLMKRADDALYKSKFEGRNLVRLAVNDGLL